MPATRLGNKAQRVHKFDVLGADASAHPRFIRHLGLFSGPSGLVVAGTAVPVNHMGPPLQRDGRIRSDAVGAVPLNDDEVNQIQLWIDERMGEYRAQVVSKLAQYIVKPHVRNVTGSGGRVLHQQFSCAGFVIEALRDAGIDLLDTNEQALPKVDLPLLRAAYPSLNSAREALCLRIGLSGNGPWPVVLCGYVLHSLDRPESEIRDGPYSANPGDELF